MLLILSTFSFFIYFFCVFFPNVDAFQYDGRLFELKASNESEANSWIQMVKRACRRSNRSECHDACLRFDRGTIREVYSNNSSTFFFIVRILFGLI